MKKFSIKYKNNYKAGYSELISLTINNKEFSKEDLSFELQDLLLALNYVEDINDFEVYNNIAMNILGYDAVINALKEIEQLGYKLVPSSYIRKLVIIKNKNKYKGLMRH